MTMTTTLEESNAALRQAVEARMEATPADDPKVKGWRKVAADAEPARQAHRSSQAFFALCDRLKEIHAAKSRDYGSASDPLANIRNGAEFVGVEPWRAAMVRLSDKVTRLATFNRTGTLEFEGVEDTLLDLASYSLLALLLHREQRDA